MKTVLSNGITATSQQPYTQTTHQFYNAMTLEATLGVLNSLLPPSYLTGKLVILSGGVVSIVGTDYTVTDGYAYYNGELFRIVGATVGVTGPNVGVWSINEVNDSIAFSDGVSKPIHRDRTIILASGTTGVGDGNPNHTYLFDYGSSSVVRAFDRITTAPTVSGSPTSTLNIGFFELKKNGSICELCISGTVTIATGDVSALNTGAGYIQWTLTLPANMVPDRTTIGNTPAFANSSGNPYKAGQVYSEKLSSTTISLRFTCTQTVANGDSFVFVLNAAYSIS